MQHERFKNVHNGSKHRAEYVEIEDTIVVESGWNEPQTARTEQREFEVVGIVEDPDSSARYAVCYDEGSDEFIVTDQAGTLLQDEALAQEILDDFLEHSGEENQEEDA